MTTTDIKRGHDAFPLDSENDWRKKNIIQSFDETVVSMEYNLDTVKRLRDDVYHNPHLLTGTMNPYGEWAGRIVSTIVQGHGSLGIPLNRMVAGAGEIDSLLDDARRANVNASSRIAELERLAQGVVDAPSSRIAREKLAAVLLEKKS